MGSCASVSVSTYYSMSISHGQNRKIPPHLGQFHKTNLVIKWSIDAKPVSKDGSGVTASTEQKPQAATLVGNTVTLLENVQQKEYIKMEWRLLNKWCEQNHRARYIHNGLHLDKGRMVAMRNRTGSQHYFMGIDFIKLIPGGHNQMTATE